MSVVCCLCWPCLCQHVAQHRKFEKRVVHPGSTFAVSRAMQSAMVCNFSPSDAVSVGALCSERRKESWQLVMPVAHALGIQGPCGILVGPGLLRGSFSLGFVCPQALLGPRWIQVGAFLHPCWIRGPAGSHELVHFHHGSCATDVGALLDPMSWAPHGGLCQ